MKYRYFSQLHYKAPVLGLYLHLTDTGAFEYVKPGERKP